MSKIGISVKIDVKKLDKLRFFAANSGATYVDLTMFLDGDSEGQYGDHGFVTQSSSAEERAQGVQLPIVGNAKIFYGLQSLQSGSTQQQRAPAQQQQRQTPQQQPQQQGFKQQPTQQQGGYQNQPNPTYNQAQNQGGFQQQAPAQQQQNASPDLDEGWDDDIPF